MTASPAELVIGAPTLALTWLAGDPDAAAALVPAGLAPREGVPVFLNQYLVGDGGYSGGAGGFSVAHMGVVLEDAGASPVAPRVWVAYLTDSPALAEYAALRGAPVARGTTTIERRGDAVVAATIATAPPASAGGAPGSARPLVRVRADVDLSAPGPLSGRARYVAPDGAGGWRVDGYPFASTAFPVAGAPSVEVLDRGHACWALRPAEPAEVTFAYFAPTMAFSFPEANAHSSAFLASKSGNREI